MTKVERLRGSSTAFITTTKKTTKLETARWFFHAQNIRKEDQKHVPDL